MKEVMIQLNSMAVREKSRSMVGNAMFTAEIRKVPMKEVVDTTSNTESSSSFSISCCVNAVMSLSVRLVLYFSLFSRFVKDQ